MLVYWHRLVRDGRNHADCALSSPAFTTSSFLPLAFLNFLLPRALFTLFIDLFYFRFGFFRTFHLLLLLLEECNQSCKGNIGVFTFHKLFCNLCWGGLHLLNESFYFSEKAVAFNS